MAESNRLTLAQHLDELRGRIMIVTLLVVGLSGVGYLIHERLLELLQKPLGLDLYYTTPAGGFMLALNVSILFGVLLSVPVIIYQLARFISPAIPFLSKKHILAFSLWSVDLAMAGAMLAYFVSFPSALTFLYDFAPESISALITVEEYVRFAVIYIGGFAIMFQLPLLLLLINTGRPLPPKGLLKIQKYVIVGSFIAAAIITPTPDPMNQLMLASPPIVLYYATIVIIAVKSWHDKRSLRHVPELEEKPSKQIIPVTIEDEPPFVVKPSYQPIQRGLILDIFPQS